jgi:hypothetical protein
MTKVMLCFKLIDVYIIPHHNIMLQVYSNSVCNMVCLFDKNVAINVLLILILIFSLI